MTTLRALGAACVVALAVAGCGGSGSGSGSGGGGGGGTSYVRGGTYTERLTADPGNLNPLRAQQTVTYRVVTFAYDTLINLDRSGNVIPQLATKWTVKPDEVTFTLRKDVTCAGGTKLTASDVAATFKYVKDPKNQSTIIGFRLPSSDFTVKADDAAGTVTIALPKPYGVLLQGAGLVPIVCPDGLAHPSRLAHKTFGTGPFNVTDYVADDHVTLAARKDYKWGPNGATTRVAGAPQKVVFKIVANDTTASNLLLSGQLTMDQVQGPDAARLQHQGFQQTESFTGPDELWFNQRPGHPGVDPAVRRALVSALDLDQVSKVDTNGTGVRATSLTVVDPRPCRQNTVRGALPAHDLAAATAALEQDGWTPGAGGVRTKDGHPLALTLLYPSKSDAGAAAMELVAQQWKKLGVRVKLRAQDENAFVQTLFGGSAWDVGFLGVNISFPSDFMAFASGPASPKGQNFAAVSNPAYDRIAGRAIGTPGQAGCQLWGQAERALFSDLDVVPVANSRELTFGRHARFSPGILGTEPTSIRLLAQ